METNSFRCTRRPSKLAKSILGSSHKPSRIVPLATAIVAASIPSILHAATANWNQTTAGTYNWDSNANWLPNTGFPGAIGDTASLNNAIAGNQTINLNQAITVGTLNLQNGNGSFNTTLAAGTSGTLIFQASSGNAKLNIGTGTQTTTNSVTAPVVLGSSLDIVNTNFSYNRLLVFSGNISESSAGNSITITRGGRNSGVVFSGSNSFTGSMALDHARLLLDDSTSNTNKLSDSASVTLKNSVLRLVGNDSGAASETFGGLSVGDGASELQVVSGSGQSATLVMGAYSRSGAGTLNCVTTSTGGGTATLTTTTANTAGIIDGAFTFNSYDWAINNGSGTVAAYSGYASNVLGTGSNVYITTNLSGTSVTINSLKQAAGAILTLSGTNVISSGGVLMSGNGTITGGTLTSGNGRDLILHPNAGSITLNSAVVDNGATPIALTIGGNNGNNAVIIGGSNSFSGGVYYGGGALTIGNANALGTGTLYVVKNFNDANITVSLSGDGTIANNIVYNNGNIANLGFTQNANNTVTFSGSIGVASGNGNNFSLSAGGTSITSGGIILTGNNATLTGLGLSNLALTLGNANAIGAGSITLGTDSTSTATSTEWASSKLYLLNGVNFAQNVSIRSIRHSDNAGPAAYLGMNTVGSGTFSGSVTLGNQSTGVTAQRVVELNAVTGGTATLAGSISDSSGNTMPVEKIGSGTVALTNASNTFAGSATISGGVLQAAALANGGANSSIGKSSNAASSLVLNGGTLRYTGGTISTDRQFTLTGSGGGFDASGSGPLTFSSTTAVVYSGTGSRTLSLTGSYTGLNTLAAYIADSGTGSVALAKSGAGTWVLSNSNSYTGGTVVSSGSLVVSSANALGTGTTTVNGGTLSYPLYSPGVASTIVNNGGTMALSLGGANGFTTANLDTIFSGTATVLNAGATVALDTTNYGGAFTYGSVLSGGFGILMTGTNSAVLSASNAYTGPTQILFAGKALNSVVLANGGLPSSVGASSNAASNLVIGNGSQLNVSVSCTTDRLFTLGGSGQTWIAAPSGGLTFSNRGDIAVSGPASHNLRLGGGGVNNYFAPAIHDYNASNKTRFTVQNCLWVITGTANDYTDVTNIDAAATLVATSLANGGVPSSIGASTNVASNLVFGYDAAGGNNTLRYAGAGAASTDRLFTLGGKLGTGDVSTIDNSGGDTLSFTNTGSIAVSSTASTTLAFAGSNAIVFAPAIVNGSGTVGVSKSGSNTAILTGANTYTGATSVTGGTLQVGNGGTSGSIASTSSASISSGATLAFARTDDYGGSFAKNISGAGNVTLNSGTLTLTGSNTFNGSTTVSAGASLKLGDGITGANASTVILNAASSTLGINLPNGGVFSGGINMGSGTVNLTSSGTNTITGQVNGFYNCTLNQNGTGTTILSGAINLFYGTANVNAGVLQLNSQYSAVDATINVGSAGLLTFGTNAVNVIGLTGSGGVVLQNGTNGMTLSVGGNNQSTAFGGVLSGSNGALTVTGTSNVFTLTGLNTYTGLTTVSSGSLQIGNGGTTGSIASSGSISIASGSTLAFNRGDDYGGAFTQPVTGSGRMLVSSGTLTVSSTSSFNGDIAVATGGTLVPGVAAPLPSANLDAEGGTLNLGPMVSASFGGLKGSGNLNIVGTSGSAMTLTVGGNNQNTAFNGALSGSNVSLNKVGTATLTLGGSSSFAGVITIFDGTISVTNPYALGSGLLQTNKNTDISAHFNLTSSGTVANAITYLFQGGIHNDFLYQDANNNLVLTGNLNASGNNWNFAAGTGITSGTITLSGSNSFGGNVYFGKDLTLRMGGNYAGGSNCTMRVAGTGETTSTSVWVLDGVNLQANIAANAATSDMNPKPVYVGMESSGTASLAHDFSMLDSASNGRVYYMQTPASAQFSINGYIYGGTNSSLVKTGAGTAIFANASSYTTPVTIEGGVLEAAVLANGGANSSLGKSTNAAANLVLDGGTLRYTGGTASTDRQFALGANSGGIEANGGGAVTFSSTALVAFVGSGNRMLTLGGSNTGMNTLAASILDNGTDIVSLVKNGAGTWVLSGSNSYSGGTTVNNGILSIASLYSLPSGSLTVSGSAALAVGNAVDDTTVTAILSGASFATGAGFGYDTSSGDRTAGSDLGGALSLVKIGGNTLTLTGNNTYSGTTTVSSGTLQIGNGGTGGLLGAGAVTNNGALAFNRSDSVSIGNLINGTGSLKQMGAGVLTVTSSNSYTGATVVSSGTLALAGSGALPVSSAITINGGTLDLGSLNATNKTGSDTGVSFGSSGGTLAGSGTLTITGQTGGATSFVLAAGATAVVNENLVLSSTAAPGYQSLASFGAGASLTINGKITGPGGLFLSANGTLILTNTSNNFGSLGCWGSGSLLTVSTPNFATLGTYHLMVMEQNTSQAPSTLIYTGSTTSTPFFFQSGGLSPSFLNNGSGTVTFTGSYFDAPYGSPVSSLVQTFTLGGSSDIVISSVIRDANPALTSGSISFVMGLAKTGAATLRLSASNTYNGPTVINAGALEIGNGGTVGSINPASTITNNATLAFNRSNTLTQGTDFAATISGSGNLVQHGTGTTILSGSNSYSGGTTVSSGTLQVGNANALGTGGLTVNNGVLDLHGNSPVVPGFSGTGGRVTNLVGGTSTLTANISGSSTYAGALVDGAGAVALTMSGTGTLVLTGSIKASSLNASAGMVSIAQSGSIGAISIGATAKLELSANNVNSAKVLDTSSLSISTGGTLDLWDNALILRDQTGGVNQGANLLTIQGLVNTAFDNGAWDKPGITSSAVIADLGAYSVLTVMVYDNTVLGVDSFEGISGLQTDNGGNQVMLKTTYLGDFDGNGIVNSADYGWLDFYYGYGLTVGDLNGDGQVNSADYNGIDYGYGYQAYGVLSGGGQTAPVASAASAAAPASPEAVPEPGTLATLLAGAAGLLGFRRKAKKSVK